MKKNEIFKTTTSVIIAFILIFSATVLYWKYLQLKLLENTARSLEEISQQSAIILNTEIESELKLLSEIALNITVNSTEFNPDNAAINLKGIIQRHDFKDIRILLRDGTTYSSNGIQVDTYDISPTYDKVFEGETLVSDRIKDTSDGMDVIHYAVPIYQKNDIVAVLSATYDIAVFKNLLAVDTFDGDGYSYVIKQDGDKVIGSSHPTSFKNFQNIFNILVDTDESNIPASQAMRTDLKEHKAGLIDFYNEETKYMQYTPLEANDWYLLTVVPTRVSDKSAIRIMNSTLIVCALVVAVVVWAIIFFIRLKKQNREKYYELLYVDPITGGASYTKFMLDATSYLSKNEEGAAFIALELLNFDLIRERYGNAKGDEIMKFVYNSIVEVCLPETIVSRITDHEFIILSPSQLKADLINNLNDFCDLTVILPKNILSNTALQPAIGIYIIDDNTQDIMRIQNLAMLTKSAVLKTQEDVYAFYDDLYRDKLLKDKQIADEMVIGLQNNELFPYFQPKYRTDNKTIMGAEALVRWSKSDGTMIYPNEFIPVAEKNGFIVQIDKMMFEKVCIKQRELIDQGIACPCSYFRKSFT